MAVDVSTSLFASALDLQSFLNLNLYLERLGCILNQSPDNTNGMKAVSLPPHPPPPALFCCLSSLPHAYQNVPAVALKTRIER